MSRGSNYFRLLFLNLANLFRQDLTNYKIHPVEEEYFDKAIELFNNVSETLKSWEKDRTVTTANLSSLYAYPHLYSAYKKNNELIDSFVDGKKETQQFFEEISKLLIEYKENKTIDKKIKILLLNFFNYLANEQLEDVHFEKVENLTFEDNNFSVNNLEYAR